MEMSDVTRAIAAATSVAASLDLPAGDAIILHNSNKLTLRLTPCDVLARIAPVGQEVAQLEIELDKPCGYFLGLTAYHTYLPLREDFYTQKAQRYGADSADLLTNGPFTLTSWVHGASLTLEKNPRYWDAACWSAR